MKTFPVNIKMKLIWKLPELMNREVSTATLHDNVKMLEVSYSMAIISYNFQSSSLDSVDWTNFLTFNELYYCL